MPISDDLRDVHLTFECPFCFVPVVHKGSWFKVISSFTCAGCGENVRMGYPDKVAFFERHRQSRKETAELAS